MKQENKFDEVLAGAYRRMHLYTLAEATLQGLQDMCDIPKDPCSWAMAGYMGAISTGQTTCGLKNAAVAFLTRLQSLSPRQDFTCLSLYLYS